MSRRIVTSQFQKSGAAATTMDGYFDRVLKYVPADVVAAWITVRGLVMSRQDVSQATILWVALGVGIVFTILWTWKNTKVPGQPVAVTQIIVATAAFTVWVVALGSPPVAWDPLYGSLLLIAFTLFSGLIVPKE